MKVIIRIEGNVYFVYQNRNRMIQYCTVKRVEARSASRVSTDGVYEEVKFVCKLM